MKIFTHNENGEKIEVEYTQKVVGNIKDDEYASPITINSYESFKRCLQKDNEQEIYPSQDRTPRYRNALSQLLKTDAAKYHEYMEQLNREFKAAHERDRSYV